MEISISVIGFLKKRYHETILSIPFTYHSQVAIKPFDEVREFLNTIENRHKREKYAHDNFLPLKPPKAA